MPSPRHPGRLAIVAAALVSTAAVSAAGAAPLDPVVRAPVPASARPAAAATARAPLDPSVPPANLAPPRLYGFRHASAAGSGYYRYHDYRPPFRQYVPRRLRRLPFGHRIYTYGY